MLNIIMLNVIMLSVLMLSVTFLFVVMLSVMLGVTKICQAELERGPKTLPKSSKEFITTPVVL